MLNPSWLQTFITLVETGHFTKTASKLFMTQPGVSQHIKKLEDSCGYPLIRRENKSFDLTEQGEILYQYAVKRSREETQLLEVLGSNDAYSGTCKLSCSGSLASLIYPALLDLQSQRRELIIHVEAAPNRKILADVLSGEIHLGIVTQLPSDPRFDIEEVGSEPLCLMLPKAYCDEPLNIDMLKAIGLISHPDAEHYLSLYLAQSDNLALSNVDIQSIPTTGYVNQLSQILIPVSKGLGFTVLPQSALHSFPHKDDIVVSTLDTKMADTLYLVSKKNRPLPERCKTVKNEVEKLLGLTNA